MVCADIPGLAVGIIGFQDKPGISNAKPGISEQNLFLRR